MSTLTAIITFRSAPYIVRLTGVAQHYNWGGHRFIPDLLGTRNPDQQPFSELWIGAHHSAPAVAYLEGMSVNLDQLIHDAPEVVLGPDAERFSGRLPYLFKILDARQMLSIQAHPTLEQAREGFARENAAGIDLKAPNRNYKDDNHKPEVHVSLGDFWMLHGFRPLEEIAITLQEAPELRQLMPNFESRLHNAGQDHSARKNLLRNLYSTVMTLPQTEINSILNPLLHRLESAEPPPKVSPNFWALRAGREFPLPGGHRDRGIISIYLLNLLHLSAGQGTYQPAGMLHAYLEGVNVELMANSDNVLRGGLTPKHVDVEELMRTLTFESGRSEVLTGIRSGPETIYPTPAHEFQLGRIEVTPGQSYSSVPSHGADSLIVTEGSAVVRAGPKTLELHRGEIILAPYGIPYDIETTSERAILFKASIPQTVGASKHELARGER